MSIIFNNVRIYMSGAFFPGQKVLVEKGKIASVGSKILKNVEKVIECDQKYLVPGLIDAHTHLGLFENGVPSNDMAETHPEVTPHLRPLDGIKMRDKGVEDARRAGISTCMVCPASELPIAGICSILKTNGNSADVGLIVEQAGVLATFGEVPKNNAKQDKKPHSTRMGMAALIRETLMKAQDYYALKQSKKMTKDREIDMEALIPLVKGDVPMRACAHRAEDIMAAIRIAQEFNLKLVIEYGTEAHLLADRLAEMKVPVVLGPTLMPRFRHEMNEKTFESARILMDAGVDVAFTCDYPGLPIETLRVAAAMAIQYGLDERRALMAISENPARILGVEERIGKIKKGYDADLALFSGHPLDIRSKLEALVVDGDLFVFDKNLVIENG
ncbi:MAG: amidohydrolase family protein [Candidatus Rifleibacteriota bacterium]